MAAHTIRILGESKDSAFNVRDAATLQPPFYWRGNDVRLECALLTNGVFLTSSEIGTITVVVKALNAGPDDSPLMLRTISAGDCDPLFSAAKWTAGTGQLFVASWTRAEAALAAGDYALVISHDDASGNRSTHLRTKLTVREDQHDSISLSAPPTPAADYYTTTESDGRFKSIHEAAFDALIPTGLIGDGASHPLSERFATLAEAQAVYPAAVALTDEHDWAAIQSALDTFNTVPSEEDGGTVYIPPGHYLTNRTLKIRGPGVTLRGAGKIRTLLEYTPLDGVALRLAFSGDGDFDTLGQSGAPRNTQLKDFKFVHADPKNAGNVSTGFTTRTPLGGADLWMVLYLILDQADFEGFDIAAEFTNVPICVIRDCSITGKTRSLRCYKIDSLTAINCDLNGTYIPRNNIDNTQVDFPENVNIECVNAGPDDMTSDGIFAGGGPEGGGFYLQIIGGELGHGRAVLINEGLPVIIKGTNIEDVTNEWAFNLVGPSFLKIEDARIELRSTVTGDFSSMDSVFLLDGTALNDNVDPPALYISQPSLEVRNCKFDGWPSDKPHTIAKGNTTKASLMTITQDVPHEISWRDENGVEISVTNRIGRNIDYRFPRTGIPDTPAGNPSLKRGPHWMGASASFPEDLLTPYKTAADEVYRSSLLNHRARRVFASLQSTQNSAAGDTGIFSDPVLYEGTIPPLSIHDEGDEVVLSCSGTFANNANAKGIKFLIGWDDAGNPVNGQNDFFGAFAGAWQNKAWHCEVTAVRRSTVTYRLTTRLFIDGESVAVKNETLNVQLGQETRWRILPTGVAAADVKLETFHLAYYQGTSNL